MTAEAPRRYRAIASTDACPPQCSCLQQRLDPRTTVLSEFREHPAQVSRLSLALAENLASLTLCLSARTVLPVNPARSPSLALEQALRPNSGFRVVHFQRQSSHIEFEQMELESPTATRWNRPEPTPDRLLAVSLQPPRFRAAN